MPVQKRESSARSPGLRSLQLTRRHFRFANSNEPTAYFASLAV
jgi:hypothetical protein